MKLSSVVDLVIFVSDPNGVDPKIHKVNVNKSVKFVCYSHFPARWYFNDVMVITNTVESANFISLRNAELKNSGVYTCAGHTEHGHLYLARGTVKVMCKLNELNYLKFFFLSTKTFNFAIDNFL